MWQQNVSLIKYIQESGRFGLTSKYAAYHFVLFNKLLELSNPQLFFFLTSVLSTENKDDILIKWNNA